MGDVAAELPNSHTIIHDTITVPDVLGYLEPEFLKHIPFPQKAVQPMVTKIDTLTHQDQSTSIHHHPTPPSRGCGAKSPNLLHA